MQLPRGTFRFIRKGVRLGDIIDELASSRFTGTSALSSATLNGVLVFRDGTCVLAKANNLYGNPAWDTILAHQDLLADTAVSGFDSPQLKLALDFNKKAGVSPEKLAQKRQVPPPVPDKLSPAIPGDKHTTIPSRSDQKERDFIKTSVPVPQASDAGAKKQEAGWQSAREPVRDKPGGEPSEDQSQSPAEKDLETVDSMDLDDVAQKIRKDCKIILKQLQLDHLSEK